jgi:uncharacterized integral membrane protein
MVNTFITLRECRRGKMADPNIKETLALVDKVTITLYRIGMLISGLAMIALALQLLFYPLWFKQALIFFALGAILQSSSLHIYNKNIRWFLVMASWLGCWFLSISLAITGLWSTYLSLGLFIITFSGLAYKESFCFSLTVLKALPILLTLSWFLIIFSFNQWAALSLLFSGGLYLYMAWRKIKMPFHFYFGDRSKYEV